MRPIQWAKPVRRFSLLPFINVPPNQTVILCGRPDQFATLNIHYLSRTSVPCFAQECTHCARGSVPELYSYAPALFKDARDGTYRKGVLPVGSPFGEVAEFDLRSCQITLSKFKRPDGTFSPLKIESQTSVDANLLKHLGALWFDVRPRLLQRWGIDPASMEEMPLFDSLAAGEDLPPADDMPILKFPGPKSA